METTARSRVSVAHYVAFMSLIAEQHAPGGKEEGVREQSDNLVRRCRRRVTHRVHPLWSAGPDRPLPHPLSLSRMHRRMYSPNARTHTIIGGCTDCSGAAWCISSISTCSFCTRSEDVFQCDTLEYSRFIFLGGVNSSHDNMDYTSGWNIGAGERRWDSTLSQWI